MKSPTIGGLPSAAGMETLDVSLLSRAVRGLTVRIPSGEDIPLRHLLPNAQAVLEVLDDVRRDEPEAFVSAAITSNRPQNSLPKFALDV